MNAFHRCTAASRVVDVGFRFCLFNAKTSRVFELLASLENRFLRHNAKITINRSAEDSGFFLVIFFENNSGGWWCMISGWNFGISLASCRAEGNLRSFIGHPECSAKLYTSVPPSTTKTKLDGFVLGGSYTFLKGRPIGEEDIFGYK